jgi:hypothetical protein
MPNVRERVVLNNVCEKVITSQQTDEPAVQKMFAGQGRIDLVCVRYVVFLLNPHLEDCCSHWAG